MLSGVAKNMWVTGRHHPFCWAGVWILTFLGTASHGEGEGIVGPFWRGGLRGVAEGGAGRVGLGVGFRFDLLSDFLIFVLILYYFKKFERSSTISSNLSSTKSSKESSNLISTAGREIAHRGRGMLGVPQAGFRGYSSRYGAGFFHPHAGSWFLCHISRCSACIHD